MLGRASSGAAEVPSEALLPPLFRTFPNARHDEAAGLDLVLKNPPCRPANEPAENLTRLSLCSRPPGLPSSHPITATAQGLA